jgi:hypothetical protein
LGDYLASLLDSEIPFGPWTVAVVWSALFLANHWLARSAREANDAQHVISIEDVSVMRRGLQPKYIIARIAYAAVVFVVAIFLGGPAYVFFAGGLLVAMTYALALNLQAWLSARSLAEPNVGKGSFTFSTGAALQHMAQRLIQGALATFILGLVLGHLALLGGVLFLASTAGGYWRKSRNVRAQP